MLSILTQDDRDPVGFVWALLISRRFSSRRVAVDGAATAQQRGGLFSVQKFYDGVRSQGIPVAKDTMHAYLAYLEDAFLVRTVLLIGLWTEVCVTWPALSMLGAGYNIYVVEDCCGATSNTAQESALSRMVQAGAVRLTTIAALLEWQRDWANKEHYNALMNLIKQQGGAYGSGIEYAYTMVHHAPQSAQKPQIVPK